MLKLFPGYHYVPGVLLWHKWGTAIQVHIYACCSSGTLPTAHLLSTGCLHLVVYRWGRSSFHLFLEWSHPALKPTGLDDPQQVWGDGDQCICTWTIDSKVNFIGTHRDPFLTIYCPTIPNFLFFAVRFGACSRNGSRYIEQPCCDQNWQHTLQLLRHFKAVGLSGWVDVSTWFFVALILSWYAAGETLAITLHQPVTSSCGTPSHTRVRGMP